MKALVEAGPFDLVVGYSLGSLLLLHAAATPGKRGEHGSLLTGQVAMLAPIFAFSREAGLGGRVSRAELRLLARRLRIAPDEALAGFYARAGLRSPPGPASEFSAAALAWGLEQLEQVAVPASRRPVARLLRCQRHLARCRPSPRLWIPESSSCRRRPTIPPP